MVCGIAIIQLLLLGCSAAALITAPPGRIAELCLSTAQCRRGCGRELECDAEFAGPNARGETVGRVVRGAGDPVKSSSNGIAQATGPKISSRTADISGVVSVNTVGRTNIPVAATTGAAGDRVCVSLAPRVEISGDALGPLV